MFEREKQPAEVFCKKRIGVLRNFAKFTGKHLCQSLFFNKEAFCSVKKSLAQKLFYRTEASTKGSKNTKWIPMCQVYATKLEHSKNKNFCNAFLRTLGSTLQLPILYHIFFVDALFVVLVVHIFLVAQWLIFHVCLFLSLVYSDHSSMFGGWFSEL